MSDQQNLNHFVAAWLTPRLVEILVMEQMDKLKRSPLAYALRREVRSVWDSKKSPWGLTGGDKLSLILHQAAPRAWRLQCVTGSLRERSSHHVTSWPGWVQSTFPLAATTLSFLYWSRQTTRKHEISQVPRNLADLLISLF